MNNSKLLQESNLKCSAGSRAKRPITVGLHIIAPPSKWRTLVILRGFPKFVFLTGRELGSPAPTHQMFPTALRTIMSTYSRNRQSVNRLEWESC